MMFAKSLQSLGKSQMIFATHFGCSQACFSRAMITKSIITSFRFRDTSFVDSLRSFMVLKIENKRKSTAKVLIGKRAKKTSHQSMACRCKKFYFLFSESLVHLKETGDAVGFGGLAGNKAIGLHDSTVVVLVGFAEFNGHRQFVVEVCQ